MGMVGARGVNVLVGLVSVPLTIGYLGPERYGVWLTILSFTGLLTFADLGLGNGFLNAIAQAHATNDLQAQRRATSNALALLSAIAVVLFGLFGASTQVVDWSALIGIAEANRPEVNRALLALAACLSLSVPFAIPARLQLGQQRGLASNLWQSAGAVLSLLFLLVAVKARGGLGSLVLATSGAPVLAMAAAAVYELGFVNRALLPRISDLRRSLARTLLQAGVGFLILQIAGAVAFASDNLVIVARLGPAAVTTYAVPMRLFAIATIAPQVLFSPLWPAYAEAEARGDARWIKQALRRSLLMTALLIVVPVVGLCAFGNPLLELWTRTPFAVSFATFAGMGVWTLLSGTGATLAVFLNGTGRLRVQIYCAVAMAASALALKYLFAGIWGVAGVAWGTSLAYAVCTAIPLSIHVLAVLRVGRVERAS